MEVSLEWRGEGGGARCSVGFYVLIERHCHTPEQQPGKDTDVDGKQMGSLHAHAPRCHDGGVGCC